MAISTEDILMASISKHLERELTKIKDLAFHAKKLDILHYLSTGLFDSDYERMEKLFNDLAIENSKLVSKVESKCFIHEGKVYPRSYLGSIALPLDERLYKNADRLIRQNTFLQEAQFNMKTIARKAVSYSYNMDDLLALMPKELHKYLDQDTFKFDKCPVNYSENALQEFREELNPAFEKIKRYLVNKALFFDR